MVESSRYTLKDYFMYAGNYWMPEWFDKVNLERFDEGMGELVDLEPWQHQKDDIRFLMLDERMGLYNDAGTGKTIPMQALGIYQAAMGNKTVFCMPPKLIGQFAESMVNTYNGIDTYLDIFVLNEKQAEAHSIVDGWIQNPASTPNIVIMSYDMFAFLQPIKPVKAKTKVRHKVDKKTGESEKIVTEIPAIRPLKVHPLNTAGFNVLIFDEAHKLKNPECAAHRRIWRWVKGSSGQYMILLATGTPIFNVLMDAYGLIRLLTPNVYESMRDFEKQHAIFDRSQDYKTIVGWQNEDVLSERLYLKARRVTKEEALPNLPPMIPVQHRIDLGKDHRALYKKLLTERVLEVGDEFIDATHQSKLRQTALQLISNPNEFSEVAIHNVMDDWLASLFEDIGIHQHKIIVFAYYKVTVTRLAKTYAHYNPAVINGGGGDSDKDRLKFLRDPTCRVLFVNWKSGGAGLNLQISSYEIFYEVPTVPGDIEQAIARSHRGGQLNGVSVHIPRIHNTIANKSLNQLLSKQLKKNEVVKDKHQILAELLGK